jgi:hypothetical protein
MNVQAAKGWWDLAAAIFAFAATVAWFTSTSPPLRGPGPMGYGAADPNHQFWKDLAALHKRHRRATIGNMTAAILAGRAALMAFLWWLLQWLSSS